MPRPFFEDKDEKIQEIIRVNHAGEFGAKRIYEGQIKCIQEPIQKAMINHMLEQELEHLNYFERQIMKGKSRPTFLISFWNILGYALGAVSAKSGYQTAMLVTESIEKVIELHYQEQIEYLERSNIKSSLLDKLKKFKQDETDHKTIAISENSQQAKFSYFISKFIKLACKAAINISKKI